MTLNPISEVERQQLIKELKAHRPDALRELIAVVRRCAQMCAGRSARLSHHPARF